MQSADIALAIELPPNFGRDADRGMPTTVGVWVDGAMPFRGETVQAYIVGLHNEWLAGIARRRLGETAAASLAVVNVATRFRYNPDYLSVVAMVPAMMPMLLLMIPAMLTALSVVREKELGSIVNLYVTPVTRTEFLVGKQLPYVVLGMVNFLLLVLLAIGLFRVPLTGDFGTLALSALLFVLSSTAFGLLMSTFLKSQVAAILGTALGTLIPAVQFAGMINPISSLAGAGHAIGTIQPATYFLVICRAVFSKGLGLAALWPSMMPILASVFVLTGLCIVLLKKQDS
jgi:ribosome-dependent ATPase